MKLRELVKLISEREEIISNPPVLLDLGASGSLDPMWEPIAHFCIGVAFDADNREFGFIEQKSSKFKKMYVYNSIVTSLLSNDKVDFYLTESPYCSSTLKPLNEKLDAYHYSNLFKVKEIVSLKAKNINLALQEMGINQVDWFKTDTQGTDLRLFSCLPSTLQSKCIVAQFEPGLIDVYENEDKVHDLLAYMENQHMRLYSFVVLGPLNISRDNFSNLFPSDFSASLAANSLKHVPGWAEISYIKKYDDNVKATSREYILGWLFMILQKQYPTAYEIAKIAGRYYPADPLFNHMLKNSENALKKSVYNYRNLRQMISLVKKRIFSK